MIEKSWAFVAPQSGGAAAATTSRQRRRRIFLQSMLSEGSSRDDKLPSLQKTAIVLHGRSPNTMEKAFTNQTFNNSNRYEEMLSVEAPSSSVTYDYLEPKNGRDDNSVAISSAPPLLFSEANNYAEYVTCTIVDEVDDEIEEIFTSLLQKVGRYNAEAVTLSYHNDTTTQQPISMLRQAFNIAKKAHQNQCRKSGEPYITHPLGVAHIIADMKLDLTSLLTALLHDTVEDTNLTLSCIEEMFGDEIASCVDGVTKIAKITFTSYEEQQSENYRKLILAMSKDIVSFHLLVCLLSVGWAGGETEVC